MEQVDYLGCIPILIYFLIAALFWAAVIFVVIHFVSKHW